jgi:hypothetical protein
MMGADREPCSVMYKQEVLSHALLPASEEEIPAQKTNAPSGNTRSEDINVTGERKPILQTNTPVYEDAKGVGGGEGGYMMVNLVYREIKK